MKQLLLLLIFYLLIPKLSAQCILGSSPDCPFIVSICAGESAYINAGMVGGPSPYPYTDVFCYSTTNEYYISPMDDLICNGNTCYSAIASPLESTLYHYSYITQSTGIGGGYILVEVVDCGSSDDIGVVTMLQDNSFLYEGEKDIVVTVQNYGIGLLDNMQINWAVNGVVQTPFVYENGTMAAGEVGEFLIGDYFFEYETHYSLAFWTISPNGEVDSTPSNDTLSIDVYIENLNADSTLVLSADTVFVLCEGDTIETEFPIEYCFCGFVGTTLGFEFQSWTPEEWVFVEYINNEAFSLFPPTTTYFNLISNNPMDNCNPYGGPSGPSNPSLNHEVYVIVDQSCGSSTTAQPDYGNIFFDNCNNGGLYFFIETPSGEILDPYYTDSVNFTHFDGMLVDYEYVEAEFASPCSNATAVYITEITEVPRSLDLTIWLEGVGETTDGFMETDLSNLDLLPSEQPFNQAPWFYSGNETLPLETDDIVDWVLVELRTGTPSLSSPNTEVVFQQAAVLMSDGSIIGVDNVENRLDFYGISEGESYYVSIRHRNHLDVLSAMPITFDSSNSASYDFTTNNNQAFGPLQLKTMPNGKSALYAGDYNGDGVIQSTDYDVWQMEPAAVNVYAPTDGNLDGIIQATDFDTWLPNKAKVGSAEIQY